MAENTEYTPLPADLPENWTPGQTIAPAGADVGLSEQHGYNYLNKQVNDAQRGVNQLYESTAPKEAALPAGGTPGQLLGKTGEEDYQAGWVNPPNTGVTSFKGRTGAVTPQTGDYSVSQVTGAASTASPEFTGSISLYRKAGTSEGTWSSAVGENTEASGQSSHAEGSYTIASGHSSHAEGVFTTASGYSSHAGGRSCTANSICSFAFGDFASASAYLQVVFGRQNVISTSEQDMLIIGKGESLTSRANCFRATTTGVYASGTYKSSGADYAELFEWADGNPDQADRCGHFVTLDGEKIRLAAPEDDYILGIVSGNPSVVGDVHDDQWQGMYLYDVFGRPLWEDVEVPAETIEEPDPENPGQTITRVIIPAHTEHRQKLNPAYDNAQTYLPRSQRPEWDAVGMLGKLVAVDDGTCEVNGWAAVGEGGVATRSETRTKYRVMARLDETHIRVLIL